MSKINEVIREEIYKMLSKENKIRKHQLKENICLNYFMSLDYVLTRVFSNDTYCRNEILISIKSYVDNELSKNPIFEIINPDLIEE